MRAKCKISCNRATIILRGALALCFFVSVFSKYWPRIALGGRNFEPKVFNLGTKIGGFFVLFCAFFVLLLDFVLLCFSCAFLCFIALFWKSAKIGAQFGSDFFQAWVVFSWFRRDLFWVFLGFRKNANNVPLGVGIFDLSRTRPASDYYTKNGCSITLPPFNASVRLSGKRINGSVEF